MNRQGGQLLLSQVVYLKSETRERSETALKEHSKRGSWFWEARWGRDSRVQAHKCFACDLLRGKEMDLKSETRTGEEL